MGPKRPPRLDGFDYLGLRGYFLTICTADRRKLFESTDRVRDAKAQLLRTAVDYRFAVIAYCFMPDHLHALLEGLATDSDFRKCVSMFKQRSAFCCRRDSGQRLWQEGYYERVLRSGEAYLEVAAYIVANPLRAQLCERLDEYQFIGSDRFTLEQLYEAVQLRPRP